MHRCESVIDNFFPFFVQINFALLFARRLNISEDGARLGVVQYSDEVRIEIELGQFNDPRQVRFVFQACINS